MKKTKIGKRVWFQPVYKCGRWKTGLITKEDDIFYWIVDRTNTSWRINKDHVSWKVI